MWARHVSNVSSIPLPNSAGIPLPADLLNLTQGIEFNYSFEPRGHVLEPKTDYSLLAGKCDTGLPGMVG
jgi:hypothetical protein